MSAQFDYWDECVAIAAEECGAHLTPEQIKSIAGSVQGAHENYGMAFYSPPDGEHLHDQIDTLKRALSVEQGKRGCAPCKGTGRLIYNSGPWGVDTQCPTCHGEGKRA